MVVNPFGRHLTPEITRRILPRHWLPSSVKMGAMGAVSLAHPQNRAG